MKILIVDDDQDFAESLEEILANRNNDIIVCTDPIIALELFKTKNFDLAFLDVKMPILNGLELFLKMKIIKPDVRVVLMTGYSMQSLLDQARDNNIFGIIHKPLDINLIFNYIDKAKNSSIILIVDDDDDYAISIKEILEDRRYCVQLASTGEDAIDAINKNDYNLLLLDLRLPKMNGFQVVKKIISNKNLLPTIILSAYLNDFHNDLKQLATQNNITCLKKPVDIEELIEKIRVTTS